jgi:S1-C subfamily serine protease
MLNRVALQLVILILSTSAFSRVCLPSILNPLQEQTSAQKLPQPAAVKLTVKAMIVDRDLNVKPVPKFSFSLQPIPHQEGSEPLTLATKVDGTLDVQVVPGRYRIVSVKPLNFEGKRYAWDVETTVTSSEATLELSNDNAKIEGDVPSSVDDLTSVFKKNRDSVVTVWAEVGAGHGTGFIADPLGLVITNQHVVTTSEYIAVQFDDGRMLPAKLLASDATKDVAVLWVDFSRIPEAHAAPLLSYGGIPAEEGERVFTIGSPLHQSKVMTTGIVSKIETRAIISDLNINHGNSGGPLFNSHGRVIGITTFGDFTRAGGPGISGIIRIELAWPLLEEAKGKMGTIQKPSPEFLPAPPTDSYPIEAIKASANVEKFKLGPYVFGVGDYDIAFVTPILRYRGLASNVRAEKEKEKRNRKNANAVQGTFQPLDDLRGWGEYVGEYEPVLLVQASPRLKESFMSAFSRGMAASHGYAAGPAKLHFKTDFYKMKLLCGDKEVTPLFPGKVQRVADEHDAAVNITDATFDGLYKYPADAVTEKCGTVTIQLYSESNPNQPKVKVLDKKTIDVVAADFGPYLALHGATPEGAASQPGVEKTSKSKAVQISSTIPRTEVSTRLPEVQPVISKAASKESTPPSSNGVLAPNRPTTDTETEGTVSITSFPDGADIFVDSVGRGHTPILLKLKPGKHSVQLVLSGYKDWIKDVDVGAGGIVNVTGDLQK